MVRHGQSICRCAVPDIDLPRSLDIPQWMFDSSRCGLMQLAPVPVVSIQALVGLKTLLQCTITDRAVIQAEHQCANRQGDADATGTEKPCQSVNTISTATQNAAVVGAAETDAAQRHDVDRADAAPTQGQACRLSTRPGGER